MAKTLGEACAALAKAIIVDIAEQPDIVIVIFAKKYRKVDSNELEMGFGIAGHANVDTSDVLKAVEFASKSVSAKQGN